MNSVMAVSRVVMTSTSDDGSLESSTPSTISCCLCGAAVSTEHGQYMCARCLTNEVDLCEGLPRTRELIHCSGGCKKWCGNKQLLHWIPAQLESPELLSLCLRSFVAPLKRRAKLVDGDFVWTEPHSRRVKVKITIEAAKGGAHGTLRQSVVVTFVVRSRMCPMCAKSSTGVGNWMAEVQLRQSGSAQQQTLHRLERDIARAKVHERAVELSVVKGMGIDFRFASARHAKDLVKFISSQCPVRVSRSTANGGSDNFRKSAKICKSIIKVDVCSICKGDLVILPARCKLVGGMKFVADRLALCVRVSAALHFVVLRSGNIGAIDAQQYRLAPFTALCSEADLREYVVCDVDDAEIERHRLRLIGAGADGTAFAVPRLPESESDSDSDGGGGEREGRGRSVLRRFGAARSAASAALVAANAAAVADAAAGSAAPPVLDEVVDPGADDAAAVVVLAAAAPMEKMPERSVRRSRSRARFAGHDEEEERRGGRRRGKGKGKKARGKKGQRGKHDDDDDEDEAARQWEKKKKAAAATSAARSTSRKPRRASRSRSIFSTRRWGWGERRALARGTGLGGTVVPLVDVTILRSSSDPRPVVVKSHLAPILRPGDIALGYAVPGGDSCVLGGDDSLMVGDSSVFSSIEIVIVKKKRERGPGGKRKKKKKVRNGGSAGIHVMVPRYDPPVSSLPPPPPILLDVVLEEGRGETEKKVLG